METVPGRPTDETDGPRQDKRSLIMDRALELFARRGYDAVGVQEIAICSGVTKPTLYHYYESKLGLLNAVVRDRGAPLASGWKSACRYDGDVKRSLERIAFFLSGFARGDPVFYRFLLSLHFAPAESDSRGAAAALLGSMQDALAGTFESAQGLMGNMNGRQGLFAASFLGLLNTWIALDLNGRVKLDDALTRSVVKQFMHGIFS